MLRVSDGHKPISTKLSAAVWEPFHVSVERLGHWVELFHVSVEPFAVCVQLAAVGQLVTTPFLPPSPSHPLPPTRRSTCAAIWSSESSLPPSSVQSSQAKPGREGGRETAGLYSLGQMSHRLALLTQTNSMHRLESGSRCRIIKFQCTVLFWQTLTHSRTPLRVRDLPNS